MKQVLSTASGTKVENVPAPYMSPNEILVQTHFSVISTGTETSGMSSGNKQVNKVKKLVKEVTQKPVQVVNAAKMLINDGWAKTYNEIQKALGGGHGVPTGYSLSGTVIEVGANVTDISPGDRVACAGAGKANHAEYVSVPRNLVVKIPSTVSFEDAASVTLGSIAMQGVRQANPQLGDTVAVIGLGLLGQITVQLLKANGCRVIGIDLDNHRLKIAEAAGADHLINGAQESPVEIAKELTQNHGVDCTIIAAATASDAPLQQSMEMTRKKGTVVIVGAIGMNLQRSPFYQKEIDLKISCSYGPGRYDSDYEEKGIDYPYGYVRWTENRNMQAYLQLIAEQKLNFNKLVEKTYPIDQAANAYSDLVNAEQKPLAVLLSYPDATTTPPATTDLTTSIHVNQTHKKNDQISLAVIGAGSFFQGMHYPNLQKLKKDFYLHTVWNRNGNKAKEAAKTLGFEDASTNYDEILKNPAIDSIMICTRHNTHGEMVIKAIEAGKSVFVEKPLAVNHEELSTIKKALQKNNAPLLTGFNRRFAPQIQKIKSLIPNPQSLTPLLINYRVNAGYLPAEHWTQTEEGAGRIIGEACHMFDIFNFFTESTPKNIHTAKITPGNNKFFPHDNVVTTITYENGAVCNLIYTALGDKTLPKERIEIFANGKAFLVDDFKTGTSQDKGHHEELRQWGAFLKGQQENLPISLKDQFLATEISFEVAMTS